MPKFKNRRMEIGEKAFKMGVLRYNARLKTMSENTPFKNRRGFRRENRR